MNDTIFLYADYRGSLEVAVKTMQRDGLFLVTDFISRSMTGMRTLEAEIEYMDFLCPMVRLLVGMVEAEILLSNPNVRR